MKKAQELAQRCKNAYSANRYRSWAGVAAALLLRGYNEQEAESIMRSKWMRYYSPRCKGKIPTSAIGDFLDSCKKSNPSGFAKEVAQLVRETFPTRPLDSYNFDISESDNLFYQSAKK